MIIWKPSVINSKIVWTGWAVMYLMYVNANENKSETDMHVNIYTLCTGIR